MAKQKNALGEMKNVGGVPGATLTVVTEDKADAKKPGNPKKEKAPGESDNEPRQGVVGPAVPESVRAGPKQVVNPNAGKIEVRMVLNAGAHINVYAETVEEGKELARQVKRDGVWKECSNKDVLYGPEKIERVEVIRHK
jgi:hypothetical protein